MSRSSERFAAREPFFTVLADVRYLAANRTADAERDFFLTGEKDVAELYDIARNRVTPSFSPRTVLEYGCGVGRLAIPLARRAAHVTAIDLSPAMLAAARTRMAEADADNVEVASVDQFRTTTTRFDLITCYLVLQRLPRAKGLAIIRELLDRLEDGGTIVIQAPFHRRVGALLAASRWLRTHLPGVNAAANLALRKPADTPIVPTQIYDVDEIISILRAARCGDPHLAFTKHGDSDAVVLFSRRMRRIEGGDGPRDDTFIDARELIARSSIEDLNQTAEAYFASLTDWEHHLAKPFSRPDEAPPLLINLAVLLQGLRVLPGHTVLDYGGGTGWLSRFITQLGCRAILLDVSDTALRIARDLYEKMPVIGDRPAPQFLQFDGRHIDLPDGSVDRVICFDAFHHAPNPAEVIAELARILKPGGIAGFAEPGPNHSKTPQSQFEMRTYGVVEADVDIEWIRDTALASGFAEMKMAALNVPPFHLTVQHYQDLLDGGPTAMRWEEWTRSFMQDVRDFFLIKVGEEPLDSRHADALASSIIVAVDREARAGQPINLRATVKNTGRAAWLPSGTVAGSVNLGCHLYDDEGRLLRLDFQWADLTPDKRRIEPGETVETIMTLPPLEAGSYEIELDCVATRVGWFAQLGSKPARLSLAVSR